MRRKILIILSIAIVSGISLFAFFNFHFTAHAATADELQQEIDKRNALIEQLNAEISKYSSAVGDTSAKAKTLQNAIKALDGTIAEFTTQITATQNKITVTNLTIEKLNDEIADLEKQRNVDMGAMKETLRQQNLIESSSLIEILLTEKDASDFWDQIENIGTFNDKVRTSAIQLKQDEDDLRDHQSKVVDQKTALVNQKSDLADQQKLVLVTKADKAKTLKDTKDTEAGYQAILNQKVSAEKALEKEVFDYEAKLKVAIDPNSLPAQGSSVFSWPLAVIHITQLFGKTVDSARLYTTGTHSGVDFGTPIGTPVHAALGGVVAATGNSDLYKGCLSFGKWIMITHPNGLSSLYGHLSVMKVAKGDSVNTGDLIAYSGNTGYSTGPHLHFGVYATAGLQIIPYPVGSACRGALLPLAAHNAYLDPMVYLPKKLP